MQLANEMTRCRNNERGSSDLKSLGLVLGVSKSDELTLPLHHLGRHVVQQLLSLFVHLRWFTTDYFMLRHRCLGMKSARGMRALAYTIAY